jgi:transcriptional regulator with XRE-family HTH domain
MNNLKVMREKQAFTQKYVVTILKQLGVNVTVATYSRWEKGVFSPRSDKLPILAKALNCSVNDLYK